MLHRCLSFFSATVLFVFLQQCVPTVPSYTTTKTIVAKATMQQSNQHFFETVIAKVNIDSICQASIPAESQVILQSLEVPEASDLPMLALLEDTFVKQLTQAGFRVLDRDPESLLYLLQEGHPGKFQFYIANPMLTLAADKQIQIESATFDWSQFHLYNTALQTAHYIVLYRVLEAGILYRPSDQPYSNTLEREGALRLNVRIVEVQTGQIVAATTLQTLKRDSINAQLQQELADFHYAFFGYQYPVKYGTNSGEIKQVNPVYQYRTTSTSARERSQNSRSNRDLNEPKH